LLATHRILRGEGVSEINLDIDTSLFFFGVNGTKTKRAERELNPNEAGPLPARCGLTHPDYYHGKAASKTALVINIRIEKSHEFTCYGAAL
jgi:hypothetical protein